MGFVDVKKLWAAPFVFLAACSDLSGPSVPSQPGANLTVARAALNACGPTGPQGGTNAVVGSYVGGVVLGGLIVGPVIVAVNEDNIRAHGEAVAVDRCMGEQGYARRDLTEAEIQLLNVSTAQQRQLVLNHLIAGGSIETLGIVPAF